MIPACRADPGHARQSTFDVGDQSVFGVEGENVVVVPFGTMRRTQFFSVASILNPLGISLQNKIVE